MGTSDISVSELRQNLAQYLARVQRGESIRVTQHGTVVARIEPPPGGKEAASARIEAMRRHVVLGDVVSPVAAIWNAAQGVLVEQGAAAERAPSRRSRR